jgi:hypothetical protein
MKNKEIYCADMSSLSSEYRVISQKECYDDKFSPYCQKCLDKPSRKKNNRIKIKHKIKVPF